LPIVSSSSKLGSPRSQPEFIANHAKDSLSGPGRISDHDVVCRRGRWCDVLQRDEADGTQTAPQCLTIGVGQDRARDDDMFAAINGGGDRAAEPPEPRECSRPASNRVSCTRVRVVASDESDESCSLTNRQFISAASARPIAVTPAAAPPITMTTTDHNPPAPPETRQGGTSLSTPQGRRHIRLTLPQAQCQVIIPPPPPP